MTENVQISRDDLKYLCELFEKYISEKLPEGTLLNPLCRIQQALAGSSAEQEELVSTNCDSKRTANPVQGFVSVDTVVPEIGQEVIVLTNQGSYFFAWLLEHKVGFDKEKRITTMWHADDPRGGGSYILHETVTHWLSKDILPQPPVCLSETIQTDRADSEANAQPQGDE